MTIEHQISEICNYYGVLTVKEEGGKFFWTIDEDWEHWSEISRSLYVELLKHEGTEYDETPVRDLDFYKKLAQRDLELIVELKVENGFLRNKVNRYEQKLEKLKRRLTSEDQ